jgi:hypothetical protein
VYHKISIETIRAVSALHLENLEDLAKRAKRLANDYESTHTRNQKALQRQIDRDPEHPVVSELEEDLQAMKQKAASLPAARKRVEVSAAEQIGRTNQYLDTLGRLIRSPNPDKKHVDLHKKMTTKLNEVNKAMKKLSRAARG